MMIQITRDRAVPARALVPYVVAFLLVAAAAGLWVFIRVPVNEEIGVLRTDLRLEQQQIDVLTSVLARRPRLETALQEAEEEWAKQQLQVVGSHDGVAVAQFMRQRIAQAGIRDSYFFFQPARNSGESLFVPFQWEAQTSYAQALRILLDWQAELPSLRMDSVLLYSAHNGTLNVYVDGRLLLSEVKDVSIDWQLPQPEQYPQPAAVAQYGPRFEQLRSYFREGPVVLGTIRTDQNQRALVKENGRQDWLEVGNDMGLGQITSIERTGVVVNVDGLRLEFAIGGQ